MSKIVLAGVVRDSRCCEQDACIHRTAYSTLAIDSHYDSVCGLREWGDSRLFSLSIDIEEAGDVNAIGTGDTGITTALQLIRPGLARSGLAAAYGRVEILREGTLWKIRDRDGSVNLRQDGRATSEVCLIAGTEVVIAGRTFIAESPRSLALRNFCLRLLGWGSDRIVVVEHALRALRLSGSCRVPARLAGDGDLVPIAYAIHRYTLGRGAPFIVSDPRRNSSDATKRSAKNCTSCTVALREAQGGTLCIRTRRLPWDFDRMMQSFWRPGNSAQMMLCIEGTGSPLFSVAQIDIPSLISRRSEWPRILDECIEEASHALHASRNYLDDDEREWILRCSTLDADPTVIDIEKAALRLIAIKLTGNLTAAARTLGMARVSLERWLHRRWTSMLARSGDKQRWIGMLARSGYRP